MNANQPKLPVDTGVFDHLLAVALTGVQAFYRDRLVSLAVFGSVGRGTMRADSDIDLFLVAEPLEPNRTVRNREFNGVEESVKSALIQARTKGINTCFTPLIYTPDEVRRHPSVMLDMTQDARILFDRDAFLDGELETMRQRMRILGSRRIFMGDAWYWDLKPDFKPGEVVTI